MGNLPEVPVPRFRRLLLPVCEGGRAAYDFFLRSRSAFSFSGSRSGGGPPPWPLGAWPMVFVRRAVRPDYPKSLYAARALVRCRGGSAVAPLVCGASGGVRETRAAPMRAV